MEHRDTTTIEEIQENDLEQMTGDLTDKNGSRPGDHLIEGPLGEAIERLLETAGHQGTITARATALTRKDDFTIVRNKKRRRDSAPSEHPAAQPSSARGPDNPQPRKRPTGLRTIQIQEVKATRANIADARARQASSNQDNYVFIEHCPDFAPYQYLNPMNGHVLVGLSSKALADRLIDQGLEIEGTTLKIFPYHKRAERIIVANLPGFVEDAAIIEALRPYGRVTSIAPIQVNMAFLSFGIKCSKCGKQGRRRANCHTLSRRKFDPKRRVSLSQVDIAPPTVPTGLPVSVPSPPAPPAPSEEVPSTAPVTLTVAPGSPAPHLARLLPPGEAPSSAGTASNPPTTALSSLISPAPTEPMEVAQTEEESTSSTPEGRRVVRTQLDILLRRAPSTLFAPLLVTTPAQKTALLDLVDALWKMKPDSSSSLYKRLHQALDLLRP
ncbi:hypothetical protein LAZ67_7001437 [Cordylochernes scorpioides]|uniref:Gag-like protein n=1 Tax=Cordylochernes scorpioides TaxID=51811 RepID=A0ABY6KMB7_9ARAC|nr:hypothetical protein LAZ67_7001437 [Cordylochernes scorpioides]